MLQSENKYIWESESGKKVRLQEKGEKMYSESWDDADISERREMEQKFNEIVTRNETEMKEPELFDESERGEEQVIDYYVRESGPEIQQELEIGLKFLLPNGETRTYECIHDSKHPDEYLEVILDFFDNPDALSEIKFSNKGCPVIYRDGEWKLEVPVSTHSVFGRMMFKINQFFGDVHINQSLPTKTQAFEKTYQCGRTREDVIGFGSESNLMPTISMAEGT